MKLYPTHRASPGQPVTTIEADEVCSVLSGLHRLIYTSESREPGGAIELAPMPVDAIAAAAAKRNASLGLSGVLVAVRGHFVQILEGEAANLEIVFESICRDMRHRTISLIDFAPATERRFETWGMVSLDAGRMADPERYEDLFASILGGMAPAAIVSDVRQFLDDFLTGQIDAPEPAAVAV